MKNKYKRKFLYSILTSPILYLTINAYFWQERRKLEKIEELNNRQKRIKENLYSISFDKLYYKNNIFPWINLSDKQFRNEWEFRGLELTGYFDYKKRVLVSTTRNNEPGYNVIIPFYCYTESEKDSVFPLLVDRGWFPNYWKDKFDKITNKKTILNQVEKIKGVLYKGDKKNQFSKENDLVNKKFFTQRPEELAKFLNLENYEICSNFMIKEIGIEKEKKIIYPEKISIGDLMLTQITPQKHQEYAYFWLFVSILNFSTNIYVWLL